MFWTRTREQGRGFAQPGQGIFKTAVAGKEGEKGALLTLDMCRRAAWEQGWGRFIETVTRESETKNSVIQGSQGNGKSAKEDGSSPCSLICTRTRRDAQQTRQEESWRWREKSGIRDKGDTVIWERKKEKILGQLRKTDKPAKSKVCEEGCVDAAGTKGAGKEHSLGGAGACRQRRWRGWGGGACRAENLGKDKREDICEAKAAGKKTNDTNFYVLGKQGSPVGWAVSSQVPMLKSQPSTPQNQTVFGNGVFIEIITLKWGHQGGA